MSYLIQVESLLGLMLLAFVPLIWLGRKRLANAIGTLRAGAAVTIRSLLIALLIVALCEPLWVVVNKQLSVLFVVDRSASISNEQLTRATALIAEQLQSRKDQTSQDRVGVIGFGQAPAVELPVDSFGLDWQGDFGTTVDREQTDIHSAIKLAGAIMPSEGSRRIVVVSDGAETIGRAAESAAWLTEQGIGIDAVVVSDDRLNDVAIEKVDLPARARPSSPFDVRVVIRFANSGPNETTSGQLDIFRSAQGSEQLLASQAVDLQQGVNVFTFREELTTPGFYAYQARFTPNDKQADRFEKNNIAESFVRVAGNGQVLIVVEPGRAAEYRWISELLTQAELAVEITPSPLSFASLADFQSYDLIVLADVPRYMNGDPSAAESLSQGSLELMRQAADATGCGLLMIGGTKSFGNGDWKETPIEQAMPVSFDVKNTKVQAVTAMELVIDSSGSMDGVKLEMCRAAAREAVRNLKPHDYVGVISFDTFAHEIVKLQKASSRELISRLMSRLSAGGGTNMYPALQQAFTRLRSNPAAIKHILLMTDGQTAGSGYDVLVQQMRQAGITVSCMAIGNDADQNLLATMASTGGGQYYKVVSPAAIPRVVISETRRIARPLIFEYSAGFSPSITSSHAIVDSIPRELPPLTGYVLTTPKDNALVETLISSPLPAGEDYPILATWQYGLGRTAAWTTDAGQRWSHTWAGSDSQQKLFLQLIRWLMRVDAPSDRMQLVTQVNGEEIELLVTALDEAGEPLNGLLPVASVVSPQGKSEQVVLDQVGPGKYRGSATVSDFGTHVASVSLGQDNALLRGAFTTRYSDEFRIDNSGRTKLEQLSKLSPTGGQPGQTVELSREAKNLPLDVFRSSLSSKPSMSPAWPAFTLAIAVLLFLDVANRRIAWNGLRSRQLRRSQPQPATVSLPTRAARGTASTFSSQLPESSGASAASSASGNGEWISQVEPERSLAAGQSSLATTATIVDSPDSVSTSDSTSKPSLVEQAAELSYAERLKRAKQKAQRQ